MKLRDFASRTQQTASLVQPKILLVLIGFLFFLLACASLFSVVGTYRSRDPHPYAYLFVQKERPSLLLIVDETNHTKIILELPSDLAYTSETIGTYPIASIIDAYAQSTVKTAVQIREASLFFHVRILAIVPISSPRTSALAFSSAVNCLRRSSAAILLSCIASSGMLLDPSMRSLTAENTGRLSAQDGAFGMKTLQTPAYLQWLHVYGADSFGVQGKTITVVNASGVSGLAKQAERMLQNMGFAVLAVRDAPTLEQSGGIYGVDPDVLARAAEFFHVQKRESQVYPMPYRTDYLLVIGVDDVASFTR